MAGTVGPLLLQGHQHIAACGEEGGIAFAQQNNLLSLGDKLLEGVGGGVPCRAPGFSSIHHREEQGQTRVVVADPLGSNAGGHALSSQTSHGVSDHVAGFDGMDGGQGQQGRIAGADPHKRERPWGLGIDDGQQWNAREPGDESSQHLSRWIDVDGSELANAAVGDGNSR